MEKAIFELSFQLRKPYNEAKLLIDVFNQIIEEGGRCEIGLTPVKGGHILQIKLYRCKNTYSAASLGAKIINNFAKEDYLKITKFNFASVYYSPVTFSLNDCSDGNHGPIITISLFENRNADTQNSINQQFNIIDLSSK